MTQIEIICQPCGGTGSIESSDSTDDGWRTCTTCKGTGKRLIDDRRREIPHDSAAKILTEAIERHRDTKYAGAQVDDRDDSRLYEAALWYRDNQQEEETSAQPEG